MYAEQQGRILDTLTKLLTSGIGSITTRQDETNVQLRVVANTQAEHTKAISSLGSQSRAAFHRIDRIQESVSGTLDSVSHPEEPGLFEAFGAKRAERTDRRQNLMKKKETYIGGAVFLGIAEIVKELVPLIQKLVAG